MIEAAYLQDALPVWTEDECTDREHPKQVFGDMVDTLSGMRTLKEDAHAVARGVDHAVT